MNIELDVSPQTADVGVDHPQLAADGSRAAAVSVNASAHGMNATLDVSPQVAVVAVESPSISTDLRPGETVGIVIAQGPPGTPGPQGPSGPSFEGVAWWYGEGPPQTIVGAKPGDHYMDTATGTIYKLGN